MTKYRIDHYRVKNVYYPLVKKWYGWRALREYSNGIFVESIKYCCPEATMKDAERVIKEYHEQVTKTTVVSFDVRVNQNLIEKQAEKAKAYNDKYKVLSKII